MEVEVPAHLSGDAKNAILRFDEITSNSIAKAKEAIENKTKQGKTGDNSGDKEKKEDTKSTKDGKKKKKGMWSEIGDLFK